ncbi:MAG: VWA domain-containing protein, partial [Bacilli bacterium]|nr:VWA domain-containing protein [Bacilli bacterium]
KFEENVTAMATPVKAGYTFSGWDKTIPTTMPAENVTVSGSFTANTNTKYTIEYYTENTDGTFSVNSNETKTATTGTTVSATAKEIAGFAYDSSNTNNVLSGTVAGDGSLVLKLYYNKIKAPNVSVTVESTITRDGEAVTGGTVEYGDVLNYTVTIKNTGDADGSVLLKDIVTGKLEDITVADEYKALFETSGLTIVVKPNETITITFSGTVKAGVNEKVKNDISYSVNGGETTTITGTEYDTQKTISFLEKVETIQGTNIVIVLDESASMNGNKFATAKSATNSFIDQVFPSANNNSNGSTVAVVTFGTQFGCLEYGSVFGLCIDWGHQAYANVIGVTATDYNTATSLKNSISGLSNNISNSGTPYYIGLQNAYNILYNESNGLYKNGNKNVVIFLSDGAPDDNDDETQRNNYITALNSDGKTTDIYAIGFDITSGSVAHTTLGTVANKGVFIAGTDDLTKIFSTIHSSIADNTTSKQTSQGVAEIADTIVIDETHPINIKVNGVDNKYYSVAEVLATGYLTYTSEEGYEIDATKFAAGDVIEVIYFAEPTNKQALTRSAVAYSYGSLVSRARVQETPAPTAPEETVEEPTKEEVVEEATKDEVVEESTKEEVVEEATKEEIVEEATKEEVVEEATKEEVVEEATKEEVVEEATKEEVVEEATKEEVVEEATKEEVVEEATKEEVVEEATKEEVVEEATKEEVVEEATKEEIVEESTEVIVEEPVTEVVEESAEENEKETE